MEKWFRILLNCSIWIIHFVAFSGLIYKSSFYKSIPVVAGEPYGLGDLIDLLFTVLVISIWLTFQTQLNYFYIFLLLLSVIFTY